MLLSKRLVLLSLLFAAPVHADRGAARRHFVEAERAFHRGDFHRAIWEFRAAHDAQPDPALVYDLALAYRAAGEVEDAITAYRAFLKRVPRSPLRATIESWIARTKRLSGDQPSDPELSDAPPAVTDPPQVSRAAE